MAKKANRTRQEFIEDTLGDIRYKDYKSPLDSFNEQLNDNNANDSATTAVSNSISNGSINNASMDKDANSSTAATGNSMNGNVNGTTYCTPSMYEQMYNNGLLGSFPYAGINPIINNGYLVTKRIQDTFSAVYSAKSFLDNFYTGNSDISPNDIVGNIFSIIVDQGAYFELRAHQVTRSTIICIKVEPSDNNIHSLIIRIPPVSDINNMLAYASAIVTEDTCGSVTDTPLKEEYAMRIFKAFTDMGIGESDNSLSQDISK